MTIRKSGIRSLVAVLVTALIVGASPSQAQSLGNEFSFGNGQGQSEAQTFGTQRHGGGDFSIQICLTNSQIRRALRRYGFSDIQFVRNLSRQRVVVEALYDDDDWYYSMRVHRCRNYVDRVRPLYPAWDDDY